MSVTGKAFDLKLFSRVVAYVKPYRKTFLFCLLTTITLAGITPIRPWLVKYAFDNYITIPDAHKLLLIIVLMVGLLFIEAIIQFFDSYLSSLLGQKVIADLRGDLYQHILQLRLKYFDQSPIGMLVTRTVSDIETIADIFSEGIIVIIGDLLKLSVIIIVMFCTNVKLTLICLSTIPLLILSTWIFKNAVRAAFQDVRTQISRLNSFVQEHITGMNIVQIFNREKAEMEKFRIINQKHTDANIRSVWHYSVFFPVVEILSSISLGLLVWWGCKGILAGKTTLGELNMFIMYMNMVFRPIRQLADRFNTLQMGMVGCERVFKVLDTNEKTENNGKVIAGKLKGNISFKNVWFAYNDENWVLKDISFDVKAGQTVAIVGATGAGKSSVINILNRFYEFQKGEIIIDGINIRNYELTSLRKQVGVVLQDVFLFSGSIAANISLNDPSITTAQMIEAAKKTGAHEFISKLPKAYEYNVMERGTMLSAGQRQLISFIRAYVFNPAILVLDEATSSIDTESEILIQKATTKLTENRTSIVIAHRLATIQKADTILVFDHGKIVESGNHQQLLLHDGPYKKLFELQFKNNEVIT